MVTGTNIDNISKNTVMSSNLIEQYKQNDSNTKMPKPSTQQVEDKVVLNKDLIADFKHNKDKDALGTIVEGYVNGKQAAFKAVSNGDNEQWYEGVIDKKYVLLHCNDRNYKGKYGSEDFQLTVDYNEPSKISNFYNQKIRGKSFIPDYFTVKGKIGERNINITLPNTKIPQDSELKDILTMVLEDNGLKAQTINGEVKSLKFSASAIRNIKKRAEKRGKVVNNDIKPIFMQGISTACGLIVGSVVSALLFKFGLNR